MIGIVLLAYLILFYGLTFFWRTFRVWKVTGIKAYSLTKREGIEGMMSLIFPLMTAAIFAVVLIYTFANDWYSFLAPIRWLEGPLFAIAGWIMLAVSFIWILVAQHQMGKSWRIGIDEKHTTGLVTGGIFKLSRNPVFLGMRINLLGLFLILPNAVTLALWLLGDVLLQIQVYMEEEHLQQLHGPIYDRYRRKVRRWL